MARFHPTYTPRLKMSPSDSSGFDDSILSDDVLVEILARLPLKPLFRFKSVCKAWHRLISHHYLREKLPLLTSAVFYRYTDDQPRYAFAAALDQADRLTTNDLCFFPFHRDCTIVDCSNGLILCNVAIRSTLYVINPITKRWAELPKPNKRGQLFVLAFDPAHSPEFMVIAFTGWLTDGAELVVFGSDSGDRWVERELHWGLSPDAMSTTMRYCDGALHILAYPNYVVSVDLSGMECRRSELPEAVRPGGRIGKSGGRLCYAHKDEDRLMIWMLSGSNWVLRDAVSIQLPPALQQVKFMSFHPQRGKVVYLWLPAGKIVRYDLSKECVEEAYEVVGEGMETAFPVQIWLLPFSSHFSDCLSDCKQDTVLSSTFQAR